MYSRHYEYIVESRHYVFPFDIEKERKKPEESDEDRHFLRRGREKSIKPSGEPALCEYSHSALGKKQGKKKGKPEQSEEVHHFLRREGERRIREPTLCIPIRY